VISETGIEKREHRCQDFLKVGLNQLSIDGLLFVDAMIRQTLNG
jgi:hypothetical protein